MPFSRKHHPILAAFADGLSPTEQELVIQTCREKGPGAAGAAALSLDAVLREVDEGVAAMVAERHGPKK